MNKEICTKLLKSHGCLMPVLCNTVCLSKQWKSEPFKIQTGICHTVRPLLMLYFTAVGQPWKKMKTPGMKKKWKKKEYCHKFCILMISYCSMVTRKFVTLFVDWINTLLFEEQNIWIGNLSSGVQLRVVCKCNASLGSSVLAKKVGFFCFFGFLKGCSIAAFLSIILIQLLHRICFLH